MSFIYVDNGFEDGTDGTSVGSPFWTVSGSPQNYEYDSAQKKNGALSLWIKGPSSAAYGGVYTPAVTTADGDTIYFWTRFDSTNENRSISDSTGNAFFLRFNTSGQVTVYTTQTGFTGYTASSYVQVTGTGFTTYASNTWYRFKIVFNFTNDTYQLSVSTDGYTWKALKASGASVYDIPMHTAGSASGNILFRGYNGSDMWVDDVFVLRNPTTTTLTAISDGCGAVFKDAQATWAAARGATSGTVDNSDTEVYVCGTEYPPSYLFYVGRMFMGFDTSAIASGNAVVDATFSFTPSGGTSSGVTIHVVKGTQASGSALVGDDFDNVGTESMGSIAAGVSTRKTILLNYATLDDITLGSTAKLALRSASDLNNSADTDDLYTSVYTSRYTTDADRPKLTITYVPTAVDAFGNVSTESDTANSGSTDWAGAFGNTATENDTANDGSAKIAILAATGTFNSKTMGATAYGSVFLKAYGISSISTSDITVYRSANGTDWTAVSATISITEPVLDEFLIHDRRPQYGTPAIALGDTAYYRCVMDGVLSNTVTVVPAIDKTTIKTLKTAVVDADAGNLPNSSTTYPGTIAFSLAYLYSQDPTTTRLNRLSSQLSAIDTKYGADNLVQSGIYTYKDHNMRDALYLYLASRLVRPNSTTVADNLLAMADDIVTAVVAKTKVRFNFRGWPTSHNARGRNTVYTLGDIVKSNGTTYTIGARYRCTTAGTTADIADPSAAWSTTPGATINDGSVVWTCDTTDVDWLPHGWITSTGAAITPHYCDPNQDATSLAILQMLYNEPNSSHYGVSSILELAEAGIDVLVRAHNPDGGIPIADPDISSDYAVVDTGYMRYAMLSAALTQITVGFDVYPRLDEFVANGVSYLTNNYNEEPNHWSHDYAGHWDSDAIDMHWQGIVFALMEETNPLGDIAWSSAYNSAIDNHYGIYQQDGIATGDDFYTTGRELYMWFEYDAYTGAFFIPPSAPSGAMAVFHDSHVDVSWTDNSPDETAFYIQRQADGGDWTDCTDSPVGTNITTFEDHHLPESFSTLKYRVYAHNGFGDSSSVEGGLMLLISEAATATGEIIKNVGKIIPWIAVNKVVTMTRDIGKRISGIATGTIVNFIKEVIEGVSDHYWDISYTVTSTVSLTKNVGLLTKLIESTVTPLVTPVKATLVSIVAEATGTVQTFVLNIGKRISQSSTVTVTITKRVAKSISLISVAVVSLSRRVGKFISVVVNNTISIARLGGTAKNWDKTIIVESFVTPLITTVYNAYVEVIDPIVSWFMRDKEAKTWDKKTDTSESWNKRDDSATDWSDG